METFEKNKLKREIMNFSIPCDCSNCTKQNCKSKTIHNNNSSCADFNPLSMNLFLEVVTDHFLNSKDFYISKDKTLRRNYYRVKNVHDDKTTTLDEYYVKFINDSLASLRKEGYAYVFSLEHIKDLLHFENFKATYYEDSILLVEN